MPIAPIGNPQLNPTPAHTESGKIADAAAQFESLLIAQLLKSAREAGGEGWLGGGTDATSSTTAELAEEQFAQVLSRQGGLGLAGLVVDGLSRRPPRPE